MPGLVISLTWNDERLNKQSEKQKEIFYFLRNNLINTITGIGINEFQIHQEETSCQCSLCILDSLDLELLDETLKSNVLQRDDTIQDKLERAYLNYKTFNLKEAYSHLKKILDSIENGKNKNQKIITEFICRTNLQNLYWLYKNGRYNTESREILKDLKNQSPNLYVVDEGIDEQIKNQLDYIVNGKFLKDVSYKIDKALIEIKRNVDVERNVQYHIEELFYNIGYLHSFIRKNFLFYDLYDDFKVITEKTIDGIFAAYSVQDNIPPNLMFGSYMKIAINKFLLDLCTFYCDTKNLIYVFKRYKITSLKANTDYLIEKALNLCKSPELFDKYTSGNDFREIYRTYDHVFENLMFLISASEDNPRTKQLFSEIIKLLTYSNSRFSLTGFKHLLAEKGNFIQFEDLILLLKIVLKKYKYDEALLNKIVWIIEKEYSSQKISDNTFFEKAVESDNEKALFFLWFISSNEIKNQIQEKITESLDNKFNFTHYIDCAIHNIISYKKYFRKALEYIHRSKRKGLYQKIGNSYLLDDHNDFNYLIQLIYTFNLNIPIKYKTEFETYSNYHKFLLNPDEFDYSDFKVEWLFVFQTSVYWDKFRKIKELKDAVNNELSMNFSKELAEIFYKKLN